MKNRKHHVILTAKRLFIEKGFAHTSVQDIIEESNISKGTFYNYFSSKNDCIIAILQLAKDEELMRRQELMLGENPANKDIFVKQILLSFQINREYNLLPIFESIFHSTDIALREFVNELYLQELTWIKQRFIDIYGKQAKPYATDCAIIFYGTVKQFIHTWKSYKKENVHYDQIIRFTLKRIDVVMNDLLQSHDHLFKDPLLFKAYKNSDRMPSKQELVLQLQQFQHHVKLAKLLFSHIEEYIQFLIDELTQDKPRASIIKTIIPPFRKAFDQTPFEKDAQQLSIGIWKLFDNKTEN